MALTKRKLGNSGLEIAPIVFGGNVFGWTADEATSFHLLDAFVAAGFNAVDTADVYSKWVPGNRGGESEMIIGKWLKRRARLGGRAGDFLNGRLTSVRTSPLRLRLAATRCPPCSKKQPRQVSKSEFGM